MTYDRVADTPFSDEGLGTDYDTVEQNFDPTHLANNDNKQFPRLIHTQNSNDDPNDQIYNRDDLQVEPYSSMRADFRTNDNSQRDSQSIKVDPHGIILPQKSSEGRIGDPSVDVIVRVRNFGVVFVQADGSLVLVEEIQISAFEFIRHLEPTAF